MTIKVGSKFPEFNLTAVAGLKFDDISIDNVFETVNNNSYPGKWTMAFFWPKDFTFVCPTEIAAFAEMDEDFQDRDAPLIGISTDSEFVHWAWRKHQEEIKDLPFPMIADINIELSRALDVLDEEAAVAQRATFIIDPDGIIRFSMVNDLNVGRNPKEVLRVLDALQTDELCPCNWSKGEETIDLNAATAS